jgi:esterase/lipase superfamily enzyme
MHQDVTVVRWGHFGTPVLLFPTAGGDAEEIERFHMIDVTEPLIHAGRVKIYSCDSVAGRTLLEGHSARHCSWMLNQFQSFVRHELVPAIRMDCQSPGIMTIAAGASIGAFNALSVICRYPDVFSKAICMSGTYNMERFIKGEPTDDFYYSSPLHYIPNLNGSNLETLKQRFVLLASGQGRAEDIGESWRVAHVLGSKGIPNRIDPWGPEWHHDWPTWRKMLPHYLEELA